MEFFVKIDAESMNLSRHVTTPIYDDGMRAMWGDGRDGEESYLLETDGYEHVGSIRNAFWMRGNPGDRQITYRVVDVESYCTGMVRVTYRKIAITAE